ncbi:MAG TPA: PaaI family thioesterase [Anaeromyxobacter sp.]
MKTAYPTLDDHGATAFNRFGEGHLPGHLGIEIVSVEAQRLVCRVPIRPELMAPNGFLHAGALVAVADTLCGYGCIANLPEGAVGFTTIELKSNFLATAREGAVLCEAMPLHLGRTTHVWDATLTEESSRRTLALFRCTQLVLWKK